MYFHLCKELGKTPTELGNEPRQSRYFLKMGFAEWARRRNEEYEELEGRLE